MMDCINLTQNAKHLPSHTKNECPSHKVGAIAPPKRKTMHTCIPEKVYIKQEPEEDVAASGGLEEVIKIENVDNGEHDIARNGGSTQTRKRVETAERDLGVHSVHIKKKLKPDDYELSATCGIVVKQEPGLEDCSSNLCEKGNGYDHCASGNSMITLKGGDLVVKQERDTLNLPVIDQSSVRSLKSSRDGGVVSISPSELNNFSETPTCHNESETPQRDITLEGTPGFLSNDLCSQRGQDSRDAMQTCDIKVEMDIKKEVTEETELPASSTIVCEVPLENSVSEEVSPPECSAEASVPLGDDNRGSTVLREAAQLKPSSSDPSADEAQAEETSMRVCLIADSHGRDLPAILQYKVPGLVVKDFSYLLDTEKVTEMVYKLQDHIGDIVQWSPDCIVVLMGQMDIVYHEELNPQPVYATEISNILAALSKALTELMPQCRVYISSLLPRGPSNGSESDDAATLAYNKIVIRQSQTLNSKKRGVRVLFCRPLWESRSKGIAKACYFEEDGLHLNSLGKAVLLDCWINALLFDMY